jgi:hypothetical protein
VLLTLVIRRCFVGGWSNIDQCVKFIFSITLLTIPSRDAYHWKIELNRPGVRDVLEVN